MDSIGVANWRANSAALADNNQDNHGISSQKFHILREFLVLGYRVFLSGAAAPGHFVACTALTPCRRGHCDASEPIQLPEARL